MKKGSRYESGTRLVVALVLVATALVWGISPVPAARSQEPVRIIWLHHSVGQGLIDQGSVREGLTSLGYEFFDHGYNDEGLRLADGSSAGRSYDIPGDNTDPPGLAELFAQPLHDPPDNAFSNLMAHDVIIFKSCFPNSNISSEEQLDEFKSYYRSIRDRVAQHPDKLFITVTQPPQVPGASNPDEAVRARALARWLQSPEYLNGLPNLVTFDFFDRLAGSDNFLRPEYRLDNEDAHPNERANQEIGPEFVHFVDGAIRDYGRAPAPRAVPTEAPPTVLEATGLPEESPAPEPTPLPEEVAALAPSAAVDDFEGGAPGWQNDHDENGSSVQCEPDTAMPHSGAASLRAEYKMIAGGWGGCIHSFESVQDWSKGEGLSLWIRSDGSGRRVNLMVYSGTMEVATPFEASFETTSATEGAWTELTFPWSAIKRADWADAGGLSELDPASIVSYGFALGLDEAHPAGTLWIDDIRLARAAAGAEEPSQALATAKPPPATAPAASEPAQPTAQVEVQEKQSRGLCPSAGLPVATVGAILLLRRRGGRAGSGRL